MPQPTGLSGEEVERGMRMPGQKAQHIAAVEREGQCIFDRDGARRTGAAIEEGDFSQDVARPALTKHNPLAEVVLQEHLHSAAADEVERASRVATSKETLSLLQTFFSEEFGQGISLLRIEQRK
jgi:hypothetical protein